MDVAAHGRTSLRRHLLVQALRVIAEICREVTWGRIVLSGAILEAELQSGKNHGRCLEWDVPLNGMGVAKVQLGLVDRRAGELADDSGVLSALVRAALEVADAAEEACDATLRQLGDELEKRQRELDTLHRQMKYLSIRDPLTGLYNRRFFREEVKRLDGCAHALPVSIIVARLKGLRRISMAKGYVAADDALRTVARAIESLFDPGEVVARVGDDQFAIVLRQTGPEKARARAREIELVAQLTGATASTEETLTLLTGVASSDRPDMPVAGILLAANSDLYHAERIRYSGVARSVIGMLKVLVAERDDITGAHSDRLLGMADRFAPALGLSAGEAEELRMLAVIHDIGKISIPDRILFKEGPLTPAERYEMERHSEIGCSIAGSVPEMASLARLVRHHHERWDGLGYPDGLQGLTIPLPCRILAIMDAYDAMTNDRPYRRALDRETALGELRRCAGSQFDPELVEVFIRRVIGDGEIRPDSMEKS